MAFSAAAWAFRASSSAFWTVSALFFAPSALFLYCAKAWKSMKVNLIIRVRTGTSQYYKTILLMVLKKEEHWLLSDRCNLSPPVMYSKLNRMYPKDAHLRLIVRYLTLLAWWRSFSALRTSSCVCSRMASTLDRLRTRSLISSARWRICWGEAGMESSRTRFATISMLSGSAPSSVKVIYILFYGTQLSTSLIHEAVGDTFG